MGIIGRDAPAHADADPCSKPCLCGECVDLDGDRRARSGYWLAVRCGCLTCRERVVRDGLTARGKG